MKIRIICVGRTKQRFILDGEKDYIQRMRPAPEISEVESVQQVKDRVEGSYLVLLDEAGEMLGSRELASLIQQRQLHSTKEMTFAIGPAEGWPNDELKKRANLLLSLSRLTFSYQLSRLILVEQLYRAHTIISGHPYHR